MYHELQNHRRRSWRQNSFSRAPQQAHILAEHVAAVQSDVLRSTEQILGLIAERAEAFQKQALSKVELEFTELLMENENLRNELASSRAYANKQETGGTGDTAPPGRVSERSSMFHFHAEDDEDVFFEHCSPVQTPLDRQLSPNSIEPPGVLPDSIASSNTDGIQAGCDTSSNDSLRASALADQGSSSIPDHSSSAKAVQLPPSLPEDPEPPSEGPPTLKVSRSNLSKRLTKSRSRAFGTMGKLNIVKKPRTERMRIFPTSNKHVEFGHTLSEKEQNSWSLGAVGSTTISAAAPHASDFATSRDNRGNRATKVFGASHGRFGENHPSKAIGSTRDTKKVTEAKRSSVVTNPTHREPQAVFADVTQMKERVRQAVAKHDYNVADYYWETGWSQAMARSQYFEWMTLSVIAFNAIWIAIDMDNNDQDLLLDADLVYQVAEHSFCAYFTFEWLGVKRDCLRDAWFCFDTFLVLAMIAETWVMNLVVLFKGASQLGNTSVLKLVRLVRLTRMARMAKLLHAVPELIILIKGIAVAARTVFFTLLLLALIIYFFAIVFRQVTSDTEIGDRYFPSVTASMSTLLLDGVIPDQALLVRENDSSHFLLGVLVVMFILLATLTVMNMLVGVLCEVVSVVSAVEKEQLTVCYVKQKLMAMFDDPKVDTDGNCSISRQEFENMLLNQEAASIIQDMGVDVVGLVDFADIIFEDDIELTFGDFMELVMQLRGSNTCTVKDIVDLRKFVVTEFNALQNKFDDTMAELADKDGNTRTTRSSSGVQRAQSHQSHYRRTHGEYEQLTDDMPQDSDCD